MSDEMATRFFDSVEELQEKLVAAIKGKMKDLDITPADLDARCLFSWHKFPLSSEFLSDPTQLSGPAFGLACFALGLRVDEVLEVNKPKFKKKLEANRDWVLQRIKTERPYVAGACGGNGRNPEIKAEDLIPLFVVLKCLEAIEPSVSASSPNPGVQP